MALRFTVFALASSAATAQTCDIVTDTNPVGRWDDNGNWDLVTCPGTDLDGCSFGDCGDFTGPLYLGDDSRTGDIPDSIGSLSGVTNLHLWANQLTGQIPDSIGALTDAKGVFLDANELSGTIPSSLGNLNEMTWLAMHYNALTGTIPAEITQATKLKQLYLDNNLLTGSLPDDIGNLSELTRIAIWGSTANGGSNNDIQGSLPRSFGKLTGLEYFTISNNDKMSGYPLLKEHCQLIMDNNMACSMTDITFTACDSDCADYMTAPHGDLDDPTNDGGCGGICTTVCDYGDAEWQCTNPDVASCYNTYNPCKNLHCEKIENVDATSYTPDRDYELIVLKSGTNFPIENVASGTTYSHYSGNTISHVIKCIEVECFESQCIDDA